MGPVHLLKQSEEHAFFGGLPAVGTPSWMWEWGRAQILGESVPGCDR